MEEKEIDKYINKYIELIDFKNTSHKGLLYKINNFMYDVGKYTKVAMINKGYVLDKGDCNYNLRKSHIKKIQQIKE